MRSGTVVFFLGFLIILLPFLGIPVWWQKVGIVSGGAILLVVGYHQRRRAFLASLEETAGEHHTETFVESTQPLFTQDSSS
ncbi:hypothetical protein KC887_02215 [Candidatus Kaiserbacteria bacterium]|nr:hypothetical protein [Candidatus Kaiserbacteria bacterium]